MKQLVSNGVLELRYTKQGLKEINSSTLARCCFRSLLAKERTETLIDLGFNGYSTQPFGISRNCQDIGVGCGVAALESDFPFGNCQKKAKFD